MRTFHTGNRTFKIRIMTRGSAPGSVGTISNVPDFFDQDEFFLSFYLEYENEFRLPY